MAGAILSVTVPEMTMRSAWRGLAGNGITPSRIPVRLDCSGYPLERAVGELDDEEPCRVDRAGHVGPVPGFRPAAEFPATQSVLFLPELPLVTRA